MNLLNSLLKKYSTALNAEHYRPILLIVFSIDDMLANVISMEI